MQPGSASLADNGPTDGSPGDYINWKGHVTARHTRRQGLDVTLICWHSMTLESYLHGLPFHSY